MSWDECIKKLEEAAEYSKWAEAESARCIEECQKMNEALARAQGNMAELRDTLLCVSPSAN